MKHEVVGGGGGCSGAAGPSDALQKAHCARWQPPPGAESPEDYMLPPMQSDSISGPVAAIVIHEEDSGGGMISGKSGDRTLGALGDNKAGLWRHSDPDREESLHDEEGSRHVHNDEEGSRHVHNLMDENSSLRSLNMSLIYEREKLLRELRHCDSEMLTIQRAVDGKL